MSEKLRENTSTQDGQDAKTVPETQEIPETNTIPEEQLEDVSGGYMPAQINKCVKCGKPVKFGTICKDCTPKVDPNARYI